MIAALRHLDGAEALQMLRDELRVEQPVAADFQPRDEMHERDHGGVARAMKHALAEEGAAERNAVQSADQHVSLVHFHRVAISALEQRAVDASDARIDPGPAAVALGFGAA